MQRRDFSKHLLGSGAAAALTLSGASPAFAQAGAPVEGQHYVKLASPVAVSLPAGKAVEVVEFFWYGCPHCYAFEPSLENWVKKLPPDVLFRQVPVGFMAPHVMHQKLFYTLEEMELLPDLHRKVFNAIHQQNRRLTTESEILDFVATNGVDKAKFSSVFKSFGVNTKATRAKQLSEGYKIDGVPSLGVQGRFYTSATLAGNFDRALAVVDYLTQRARNKN